MLSSRCNLIPVLTSIWQWVIVEILLSAVWRNTPWRETTWRWALVIWTAWLGALSTWLWTTSRGVSHSVWYSWRLFWWRWKNCVPVYLILFSKMKTKNMKTKWYGGWLVTCGELVVVLLVSWMVHLWVRTVSSRILICTRGRRFDEAVRWTSDNHGCCVGGWIFRSLMGEI